MPRSADGPRMGSPSSVTRPSVPVWSPATSRSSVDLPHPEGPTITENCRSSTARETRSRAATGGLPRISKRTVTSSMDSMAPGVKRDQKVADQGSRRRRNCLKRRSVSRPSRPMVKTPSRITSVASPRMALRIM